MAGAKDRDDGETNAMLFEGASISQLVKMFDMDARDVSKKMRAVPSSGERRGFPIWRVKDAAAVLVRPEVKDEDILRYIVGMSFKDLPPSLNKEVWNGLRARIRFEAEQGDLWRTEYVQTGVNLLMQTLRMGVLLFPDKVNREEGLTPKQREIIERLSDELLLDLQNLVVQAMQSAPKMTPGIMDFDNGGEGASAGKDDATKVSASDEEAFDL